MDKGDIGVISHAREGYGEDGPFSYCVYFMVVQTETEIYTHFHAFESAEAADNAVKCVVAAVSAHTNDVFVVDASQLNPHCWWSAPRTTLEQRMSDETMWEAKDTIAEGYGHHITPAIAFQVGLA